MTEVEPEYMNQTVKERCPRAGLVMEGGAMRGMFTCGVIDIFMENDITFDSAIGVSAGAVFGCNLKSRQIGRAIRYNKRFCRNKNYESIQSLLKTGDLYNADFCYRLLPDELDPWDSETFAANPMDFSVVCTDVETGEPVYHLCTTGVGDDMTWFRASASMPVLSRIVEVGGHKLLDGGVTAPIPLKHFQETSGCSRIIVILTRPRGFVVKRNHLDPIIQAKYRDYPAFIEAWKRMDDNHNETLRYVEAEEDAGRILVIRPVVDVNIGKAEKNPDELERVYQAGRRAGRRSLDKVRQFLNTPMS